MIKICLALFFPLALAAAESCTGCHDGVATGNDIHLRSGIGCVSCHGGDATSAEQETAMSRARGFKGKPARTAVPQFCGKCHADAALMHRFNPQQRVDQLAQYLTSTHGKRIAAGDTRAAVCTDCHGVHEIRAVSDPLSPVHPLRLPDTCGRCHNQIADYRASVHWEALSKRGDSSAPGCAACHGNHGAAPPQVASVGAVCGTCHPLQEQLYSASPHAALGCVACHGNHAIHKPTEALLASACSECHEPGSQGAALALDTGRRLGGLSAALDRSQAILDKARLAGMEVSDAILREQDANEALIKARVAVHAFKPGAVSKPVDEGLAIARETWRAGNAAMEERDRRRFGLGFSLLAIVAVIFGLRLKLSEIEGQSSNGPSPAGGGDRKGMQS